MVGRGNESTDEVETDRSHKSEFYRCGVHATPTGRSINLLALSSSMASKVRNVSRRGPRRTRGELKGEKCNFEPEQEDTIQISRQKSMTMQ